MAKKQIKANAVMPGGQAPYQLQNGKTHLISGILAGAAVAYLLTNKKVKRNLSTAGSRAWRAVYGEVEELKERLEDAQAELEYYKDLHKGD